MKALFVCTLVADTVDEAEEEEEPDEEIFPPPATSEPSLPPGEDEEEKVLPPASTAPPYVQPVATTSTHTSPPATPSPATPPAATPPPEITITPLDTGEPEKNTEEEEGMKDRGKKRDATEETEQKEIMVTIHQRTTSSCGCVCLPPLPLACLTAFFILHG